MRGQFRYAHEKSLNYEEWGSDCDAVLLIFLNQQPSIVTNNDVNEQ